VKYTPPEGRIRIYTELKQDSLRVFVEDTGLGIGAEDQAQIFERFYRVRRPETDSIEGTGLGLAIVKSLIEAHQGKIDLKSALGEGSTFRVTLPLQ
jgi:two-component system, OmpR family, phosphate regulon sensor histidine kinase PhoR